ncbi:hypothetical protein AKJ51_01970 [candidate division MSBL1 archaeon SCGC-AAA382A20]|uniref:Uncharacterized protein n=1 Tax=candidate division MSBL1 archaeon SCGC-AAA382A20 TaxID=1698280 RepID=A0A133VL46_9EURY|nr:hypothetical protein AKJ51_01970 [candidate division MSBL1 archaeon SCGC-AAA382A20]
MKGQVRIDIVAYVEKETDLKEVKKRQKNRYQTSLPRISAEILAADCKIKLETRESSQEANSQAAFP